MFRVFRALRVVRVVRLAPSYALHQQLFRLGITVFSIIFVASGLFQSLEYLDDDDEPMAFHEVVWMCGSQRVHTPHPASLLLCQIIYYMTSTVIGRPRVPSDSLIGHLVLIITIVLSATAIPSILAPLVKVWVEAGVLAWVRVHTPTSDLKLCVACAGLTQSYHIVADARPHVIVTGHVDPQRLGAFLGQFFDDSRALSQVCTIPLLCSCL